MRLSVAEKTGKKLAPYANCLEDEGHVVFRPIRSPEGGWKRSRRCHVPSFAQPWWKEVVKAASRISGVALTREAAVKCVPAPGDPKVEVPGHPSPSHEGDTMRRSSAGHEGCNGSGDAGCHSSKVV